MIKCEAGAVSSKPSLQFAASPVSSWDDRRATKNDRLPNLRLSAALLIYRRVVLLENEIDDLFKEYIAQG